MSTTADSTRSRSAPTKKLLAAGVFSESESSVATLFLVQLNTNGTLDTTFARNGVTDLINGSGGNDSAQPDSDDEESSIESILA